MRVASSMVVICRGGVCLLMSVLTFTVFVVVVNVLAVLIVSMVVMFH